MMKVEKRPRPRRRGSAARYHEEIKQLSIEERRAVVVDILAEGLVRLMRERAAEGVDEVDSGGASRNQAEK